MGHQVFLSHSSKDKAPADAACVALEAAGHPVWIAPRDIRAGSDWGETIVAAINDCRVMVLVFSAESHGSKQVLRELERAVAKGVAIVPVRVDDTLPTGSFEYFLSATHWLDARRAPFEQHLRLLTDTVSGLLQDPGSAGRHAGEIAQVSTRAGGGDPAAQHALALRHLSGDGVARDETLAQQLLTRAAEQGLAVAQHDLAELFAARDDRASAFRWYSRAARLGHVPSQARIDEWGAAQAAATPLAVAADAVASATAAAEPGPDRRAFVVMGLVAALAVGGYLWSKRKVVPVAAETRSVAALVAALDRGDATVIGSLAQAADAGDVTAAWAVARALDDGAVVPRDAERAMTYYRLAAPQRVEAAAVLARQAAFTNAPPLDRDALEKAAELGDAEAAFALATMYAEGQGVAADAVAAKRWRERAERLAGFR